MGSEMCIRDRSRRSLSHRETPMTVATARPRSRTIQAMSLQTAPIAARSSEARFAHAAVVVTHVWAKSQAEADRRLGAWNGPIHQIRCRIEKIFGTWKRSYGFRRMRWRGLAKASLQTRLTAIAYNLKRTRNILNPA